MKEQRMSKTQFTRREFLGTTAALAAFSIVPRHVLARNGQPAPGEKMNIGCVGVGGMQGGNDVQSVSSQNIYALCDVDESQLNKTAAQYPNAKRYRDFHEMLDKEQKNLDGIKMQGYKKPDPVLKRSPGHFEDWIRACKGGEASCSNFSIAGPYAEWMLLGAICWRFPNEKLLWDGKNLRFTNNEKANEYVKPKFRKGWELTDVTV